ncbi:MAG: GldG family protein [Ruminococcus sp.]|nr:GldG family protein [Ruminococcus sp.]
MSKKEINENIQAEAPAAEEKKPKNLKKLKFGSMSVAVLVLVIAIVVVLNLMVNIMSKRYPMKVDLTPDKRYELTDETVQVLKDLDKDVEITVTSTRETFSSMATYFQQMYASYYGMNVELPYDMIPEILDKYAMYAEQGQGSVSVRYADINKDPDIVSRFSKSYNGEITDGYMIVSSGDRVKVLTNDDVIGMIKPNQSSSQNAVTMSFAGESVITSAIMSVVDSNPVSVAVAKTMNGQLFYQQSYENIVVSVEEFLEKNGYDCEDIDIASDDLSVDKYDMIVVAVPASDFTVDVIEKLSDFLYNGGKYQKNMLYIPNLYATDLPNIEEFLADWSIQVEDSFINDDQMIQVPVSTLGTYTYAPMVNIADADTVGQLPNESLPIAAPGARPITLLSKNNESVTKAILTSGEASFLMDLTGENDQPIDTGSFNVAALSYKETQDGMSSLRSSVLVIGSSFMVDNSLLANNNTYNNASVFMNMVNSMTGKDGGVVIADKALQQSTIAPTTSQAKVIKIMVIYVLPALVALAGIIVLLRRRNK